MSFSKANIIKSKAKEICKEQIVNYVTTTFYFVQEFCSLEDEQKQVFVPDHLLQKFHWNTPHRKWNFLVQIFFVNMKEKGHTYLFRKFTFWFEVLFKHQKGLRLRVKSLLIQQNIIFGKKYLKKKPSSNHLICGIPWIWT